MTALDARFRKLAQDKIAKYGKMVTLTRVIPGEYNTLTGEVESTVETTAIKAIIEDYSLITSGAGFTSGLIFSGDKKFTIAAMGIEKPTTNDKITLNSKDYNVVRVTETWSGEEICLYEVQGRF